MKTSLRALSHRNYRLFFTGQTISLIGTWMTRLASSWLVYRLTGDPFMLGLVAFASLAPSFFLGPIAGVWVDRSRDLKRLIFLSQVAGMLQSLGLVAVSMANLEPNMTIGLLITLNVVQGVINAFDMPGRQAFLPRIITTGKDLANGIALNSMLFNIARLIGPALAGGLIALFGETWCFALDALSYVGVLWALNAMDVPNEARPGKHSPLFGSLMEGFRYAWGFESIRAVLFLTAVLSFMGMPYLVLLPIYAKEILLGGPSTLGWLTAAAGLGAVFGALRLARRESIEGIGKVIVGGGVVFAGALLAFAYSKWLPLSLVLLLGAGFGMLTQSASCNTILQTIVEPDKRGRVMSLYTVAFLGMGPFGSLLAGYAAKHIGAPNTLAISSAFCALSTLYFLRRLPALKAAAAERHAARSE